MTPTPKRVLVVDDEPRILDIVKYFLEQGGFEVTGCPGKAEALEAAGKEPYDVAILDIVLNGASGYDVAGRLKQIKNTGATPVLFMSSKVEMADLFLENYDGRAEFIQKPFRKDDLLAKVKLLLGGGGREAQKPPAPARARKKK
jgi:DNA-binding response OmpR family regulator